MSDVACTELRPWTPPPGYLPLGQAFQQYTREHVLHAGGDVQRLGYVARDFFEFFGPEYDIAKIGRKEGREYAQKRINVDGKAPPTARREISFLRAVIGHAVREERLKAAPTFWMPPNSPPRVRYLTREEYRRLMQSPLPRRIRMFFLLAFNTGARSEAIEELTWDRVDFMHRTIDYRVSGVNYKNKRRVVAPINDSLLPRLEAAYARPDRDEFVIGAGCTTWKYCKEALRGIGIDERGVARHVARHTFASWLLQADPPVPIYEVAQLLGDTVGMVERVYSHISTQTLMRSANKI